jgi:transcriptional regulator with GAF, ATPase, and Fis domain
VIVVFCGGAPMVRAWPLVGGMLELGRGDGDGKLDDGRVSRQHARVAWPGWMVTDLSSQNGTFVDGEPIAAHLATPVRRVIRIGDSLLVTCDDVRPYVRAGVRTIDGFVRGPAMQEVLDAVSRAARGGTILHIRGETGTGKEGVAGAFHRASGRTGPLIAVNCATIPPAIADRLLFGAKRGAYSGAEADAAGYVQEADGGTLFLDEIGELELAVQAKLLRVLESNEVLAVGATRARKVDFALCSATNKDLRAMVAAGALREDLYFRLASPVVSLPALRNRPEEIPMLIARALTAISPTLVAHPSLVEQCLLRAWPGNVRELLAELRTAAQATAAEPASRVTSRHLSASAGSAFGEAMPHAPVSPAKRMPAMDDEWRRRIADALRAHAGNIAATARALGLHRTQLRRLMKRHALEGSDTPDDAE